MSDYTIYMNYFDKPDGKMPTGVFTRFADVLEYSINQHCTGHKILRDEIPPAPKVINVRQTGPNNLAKISEWEKVVQQSNEPVMLLDADALVLRDVSDIWEKDFDVAYCRRPGKYPIIGGVLFIKPTKAAKEFCSKWLKKATRIFCKPTRANELFSKYGGLSQTTLNILTKQELHRVNFLELDSVEWNLCDETWHKYDPDKTRIVHYKGALRRYIFDGTGEPLIKYDSQPEAMKKMARIWYEYAAKTLEEK